MIIRSHRFGDGHIFVTKGDIAFPLLSNEYFKDYIKRKI